MLDIILSEFHYSTLWNGGILIFSGFIFIIYFLLLPEDQKYPMWKKVSFVLGMAAIFASLGSPINVIARIQFSSHIIQLILLMLVAPPLLIIGFKTEIFERAKEIKFLKVILEILTKPIVGFLAFFIVFYAYHIASVFNFARLDLYINYFFMLLLLFVAILLWIPIVLPNYLSKKKQVVYTLLSIVFLIPYSLILIFHQESLYSVYTDVELFLQSLAVCMPNVKNLSPQVAAALLPFNPIEEQAEGGIILIISQIIIFGTALISSTKLSKQK